MNMNERIREWNEEPKHCSCGNPHREVNMQIYMQEGAVKKQKEHCWQLKLTVLLVLKEIIK